MSLNVPPKPAPPTPDPENEEPAAVVREAPDADIAMTPSAPKSTASQSLPALPLAYFAPADTQLPARRGFWRGSPAEIIFATLTTVALISAVIFSVVGFPGFGASNASNVNSGMNMDMSAGTATTAPSSAHPARCRPRR